MLDPMFSLREIVDGDDDRGMAITENLNWFPSFIWLVIQNNNDSCSKIHAFGNIRYVQETPEEIVQKMKEAFQKSDEHCPFSNSWGGYEPKYRVYHDMEKTVLLNMDYVNYVSPITSFQTKFKFKGKGEIIIRAPLKWLDIPADKIKLRKGTH